MVRMCLKKQLFFCLTLGYIIKNLLCLFAVLPRENLLTLKTDEITKAIRSQVACAQTSKRHMKDVYFSSKSQTLGHRKSPLYFNHGDTGTRDLEQVYSVLTSVAQWTAYLTFILDYSADVARSSLAGSRLLFVLFIYIFVQIILDIIMLKQRRFYSI